MSKAGRQKAIKANLVRCSFCGLGEPHRGPIIEAPGANACEDCIRLLAEVIEKRYMQGPIMQPRPVPVRPQDPCDMPMPTVNWDQPGYVYFLHALISNRVKIGFSLNPERRIAGILTSCPEQIVHLGSMRAGYPDEAALHKKFEGLRVHREWFEATPDLLIYIRTATK